MLWLGLPFPGHISAYWSKGVCITYPSDTSHTENPKDLFLGIMAQRSFSLPLACNCQSHSPIYKEQKEKKKKKGEIPARKAANGTYACRKAPIIKKMPTSAVAWLTATGVLETAIPGRVSIIQHVADRDLNDVPFLVQAAMSTLS